MDAPRERKERHVDAREALREHVKAEGSCREPPRIERAPLVRRSPARGAEDGNAKRRNGKRRNGKGHNGKGHNGKGSVGVARSLAHCVASGRGVGGRDYTHS